MLCRVVGNGDVISVIYFLSVKEVQTIASFFDIMLLTFMIWTTAYLYFSVSIITHAPGTDEKSLNEIFVASEYG